MNQPAGMPEPSFGVFVDQLFAQGMIELGEIPNPITKVKGVALTRAQFTIKMLEILREKTKESLEPEEESHLDAAILELMSRYARINP